MVPKPSSHFFSDQGAFVGKVEIADEDQREQGAQNHHDMEGVEGQRHRRHRLFRLFQIAVAEKFLVLIEVARWVSAAAVSPAFWPACRHPDWHRLSCRDPFSAPHQGYCVRRCRRPDPSSRDKGAEGAVGHQDRKPGDVRLKADKGLLGVVDLFLRLMMPSATRPAFFWPS
jgi:hypothetical protein